MATKKTTNPQYKSVLKGEAKFKLDERTKKTFAEFVKKAKKRKVDQNFSQTIMCGPEEFAETEKKQKTKK